MYQVEQPEKRKNRIEDYMSVCIISTEDHVIQHKHVRDVDISIDFLVYRIHIGEGFNWGSKAPVPESSDVIGTHASEHIKVKSQVGTSRTARHMADLRI